MRVLTAFTIIFFTFISLTKADDIREFSIEGFSVGDSLLDHFDENEITKTTCHFTLIMAQWCIQLVMIILLKTLAQEIDFQLQFSQKNILSGFGLCR